ncbi:MAG TPA: NAD-dependent epimerase/dehydratase family protein, partial [Burkholderiales bacterium]|nr:NAD-dependent epimerase/dehydratase family protein [Burkholderiales bacterium]
MTSATAVLVTGADGFIGRALCTALAASGRQVKRAVRAAPAAPPGTVAVGELGPDTDWGAALEAT